VREFYKEISMKPSKSREKGLETVTHKKGLETRLKTSQTEA